MGKYSRKKRHIFYKMAQKVDMPPGSLAYVGEQSDVPTLATLIEYGGAHNDYHEIRFTQLEQLQQLCLQSTTLWLNLHGLADLRLLQQVGQHFHLHPLTLEDIANTQQRPKIDAYPDYLFIVAKLVGYDSTQNTVLSEQISLVLGKGFVLTFQEKPTGTFDELRHRLKDNHNQVRKYGPDYLVYSLLDKIVDRYFTVLENLGEQVELLEDNLADSKQFMGSALLQVIQQARRETLYLRRALWPLREIINALQRDYSDRFQPETRLYLRDIYDHSVQLIESLEMLRDLMGNLTEMYLSMQSNLMSREMRFLAMITTLFMPITFISGIYGMNFKYMPELAWEWGYAYALGLMIFVVFGMGLFFWRRKWFSRF